MLGAHELSDIHRFDVGCIFCSKNPTSGSRRRPSFDFFSSRAVAASGVARDDHEDHDQESQTPENRPWHNLNDLEVYAKLIRVATAIIAITLFLVHWDDYRYSCLGTVTGAFQSGLLKSLFSVGPTSLLFFILDRTYPVRDPTSKTTLQLRRWTKMFLVLMPYCSSAISIGIFEISERHCRHWTQPLPSIGW